MTRVRAARAGFTMLEAIVALAIVGLVCVGVLAAFGGAMRADATAAGKLPLAALATERLAAVDISSGSLERLPDSVATGTFPAPYEEVTWETSASRVQQARSLYDVTIRVRAGGEAFTLGTRRYRPTAIIEGVAQ